MMQWKTLFQKELQENWRNFKWVWVPLVIILLSIMDPITTYYLPMIMEAAGGLPEGAVFEIPTPKIHEVVMMSLGQLSSLGVFIIVLISMGVIAGERKSGVAELVLVKPVSYRNYITSKWVSLLLLVWVSLFLGMLTTWYYINLLFGDLSLTSIIQVTFFYGLWYTLVITFSILYNTLVKTPGLVAAFTIITIMVMSILTQIFNHILTWSPNTISEHIQSMLVTGEVSTDLIATSFITVIFIIVLLMTSIFTIQTKELAN